MSPEQFTAARKAMGLTQTELAERFGVTSRAIQDLEAGVSRMKALHVAALERIALTVALERNNPMLAPLIIRREAAQITRLLVGET